MKQKATARTKWCGGFTPIIILVVVILGIAGYFGYKYLLVKQQTAITTFEECAKVPGNTIQTTYPAVCITRDGRSFSQRLIDKETPSPTCVPLPSCAYSNDPNGPVCKIGEKPSSGGTWCPRYTCPVNGWVDCEPSGTIKKPECSPDAMAWYKINCPDFEGGAY